VFGIPIDEVIDILHVTHAQDRIEEYRAALAGGAEFPPISVIRLAGRWFIADGHKRYCAYRLLNRSHITVEEWTKRRWLKDQLGQFGRKTRQQIVLPILAIGNADARKKAKRVYGDTWGHFKRMGASLLTRRRSSALITLDGEQIEAAVAVTTQSSDSAQAKAASNFRIGTATNGGVVTDIQDLRAGRVFQRLVHECLQFSARLILATLSMATLSGSQLYLTWIAKQWAEGPLVSGNRHEVASLLTKASLVTLAMMIGLFSSRYLLASLNQSLVQNLRDRAQRRLLEVRLPAVRQFQAGELMSRIFNDAGALSEFVREILRRLIGESMVLIGAIAIIFYLNWRLALVAGGMVPIVAVILGRIGTVIRHRSARAQQDVGELSGTFSEQVAALSTIKGFQTEIVEHRRFAKQNAAYRRQVIRSEWWSALLMTTVWVVTAGALLAVVWYGSAQVISGKATQGALLAFCLYAVQTVEPLRRLSEVQAMMQRAIAAATRVFQIIDLEPLEVSGAPAALDGFDSMGAELRFEQVQFRYRQHSGNDRPVLDISELRIGRGETIAIVSSSGGGKTTIANLLMRFYDPNAGRITLNGSDLREIPLARLRRMVCVAEQEPFVFRGSLIENIRYGSAGATEAVVRSAADQVGLAHLIASLPGGLNALLAEGGRNLSGGQKQRIALARAVVRDPIVLVLDEATSALDSESEGQIFANLQAWLARRTVLVLAHRLATISRFSRVIVLENGRIIGDGAVTELVKTCPAFGQLFAEQLSPLRSPTA
jgi:subfamily B ATP-binding cassette protein MsbA